MLGAYRKSIVAAIGGAATALTAALADGSVSGADWLAILLAAVTAAGVLGIPNRPTASRVKPSIHDIGP